MVTGDTSSVAEMNAFKRNVTFKPTLLNQKNTGGVALIGIIGAQEAVVNCLAQWQNSSFAPVWFGDSNKRPFDYWPNTINS
jgi:hypothetical protein